MHNKTDILNELKELSPALFSLKENDKGLSVPTNYFEALANSIITEINAEGNILLSLKKENPETPAGYFDTLGDHVLSKIKTETKEIEQGKIIVLPKQQNKIFHLFKRVALAATVVGAVFLMKQVQQPVLSVNNCEDGIACLTQDEIYNYMNENSHEFDMQQIQETVKPALEKTETKIDIQKEEATKYIETNKIILDVDDASTDIF